MKAEISVGVSSPTLVTLPELILDTHFSINSWRDVATSYGYDQIEWRPLSHSKVERQIEEKCDPSFAIVGSAEQSFRGEKTWQDVWNHKNRAIAAVAYMLFPHRTESLRTLQSLQKIRPDIPMTVYPAINEEEEALHSGLAHKLIQPNPDVVDAWNAKSFEDLMFQYDQRGYGINLDLFHFLRLQSCFLLPPINEAVLIMGDQVKEIQYSANRTDFGKEKGTPFEQELLAGTTLAYDDVIKKSSKSKEMRLLLEMFDQGFQGSVVTEVITDRWIPRTNAKQHRTIAKNLKQLVSGS